MYKACGASAVTWLYKGVSGCLRLLQAEATLLVHGLLENGKRILGVQHEGLGGRRGLSGGLFLCGLDDLLEVVHTAVLLP